MNFVKLGNIHVGETVTTYMFKLVYSFQKVIQEMGLKVWWSTQKYILGHWLTKYLHKMLNDILQNSSIPSLFGQMSFLNKI